MKLINIEGLDKCGKNILISALCHYYDYNNIIVRHCAKPPKGESFDWQKKAFINEAKFIECVKYNEEQPEKYFDNIIILNTLVFKIKLKVIIEIINTL